MRLLLSLVTLTIASQTSIADVSYKDGYKRGDTISPPTIMIHGEITKSDIKKIDSLIPIADENASSINLKLMGAQYGIINFELNSHGGDLAAAMAIGMKMREVSGFALIKEGATCASSCVFLLAGAPHRNVLGRVGIHRPYLPNDENLTATGQKRTYKELERNVKGYLEFMNIPITLYDRMLRISSDKVHWLSMSELQGYGLNENDPYEQEASTAKMAKAFGVSKKDYLEVISIAEQQCNQVNYSTCFFKLLDSKRK